MSRLLLARSHELECRPESSLGACGLQEHGARGMMVTGESLSVRDGGGCLFLDDLDEGAVREITFKQMNNSPFDIPVENLPG